MNYSMPLLGFRKAVKALLKLQNITIQQQEEWREKYKEGHQMKGPQNDKRIVSPLDCMMSRNN